MLEVRDNFKRHMGKRDLASAFRSAWKAAKITHNALMQTEEALPNLIGNEDSFARKFTRGALGIVSFGWTNRRRAHEIFSSDDPKFAVAKAEYGIKTLQMMAARVPDHITTGNARLPEILRNFANACESALFLQIASINLANSDECQDEEAGDAFSQLLAKGVTLYPDPDHIIAPSEHGGYSSRSFPTATQIAAALEPQLDEFKKSVRKSSILSAPGFPAVVYC